MREARSACLVVNALKEGSREALDGIRLELERLGISVTQVSYEGKTIEAPLGDFDFAITLGGDGSVLFAARAFAPKGVPIIPVNLGRLGFLAEISPGEWAGCFHRFREGELRAQERLMVEAVLVRGGREVGFFPALNEGALTGSGTAKLISFSARVLPKGGGEKPQDLGRYRADGLLLATPTGSTAYSLAAGGPILPPDMEAFIFNPILPFTLSNRPVVLPSSCEVEVGVDREQRGEVILTMDGQVSLAIRGGDLIRFRAAPYRALIVPSGRLSFYDVLRTKLSWAGGADA